MMIKRLVFLIITAVTLCCCTINEDKNSFTMSVVFEEATGWGYEIKKNDQLIIRQMHIPCLQGEHTFSSKKDASKTGKLVLDKLSNGQLPSCSIGELIELEVLDQVV